MKLFLAIAVLGFALVGCKSTSVQQVVNTVACQAEASVDAEASSVIVSTLACANVAQVQSDVAALVAKTNVCQPPAPAPVASAKAPKLSDAKAPLKGSAVGMVVCPLVSGALFSYVNGQIPAAWGCTGGSALPSLQAQLLAGCEAKL